MKTKTTTEIREAVEGIIAKHFDHILSTDYAEDEIMQIIQQEKQDLLENLRANLPEADKAEAIKHRPDDSVGFMLGWNAYESKLSKKLTEMSQILKGKGEK